MKNIHGPLPARKPREGTLGAKCLRGRDWIKLLIPSLVALECADGFLTYSATGKGPVSEANPILKNITWTGNFLLMKISGALLVALMLWVVHRRFPRISIIATSVILIFYMLVFSWNMSILFKFGLA